mmetsp:Transcript_69591/g.225202  ORF Transcript_69591/g.225202 Transcript_69591/m.225202 type:complete len:246 (+) Transcript_69591:449-1186(+)
MRCSERMLRCEMKSFAHTVESQPKRCVSSARRLDSRPPGGSKAMHCTLLKVLCRWKARRQATPAPRECPTTTTRKPSACPPGPRARSSTRAWRKRCQASCAQLSMSLCTKRSRSSSKGGSRCSPGVAWPRGSKKIGTAPMSAMTSLMSDVPRTAITSSLRSSSRSTATGGEVPGPWFSQVAQSTAGAAERSSSAPSPSTRRSEYSCRQQGSPSTGPLGGQQQQQQHRGFASLGVAWQHGTARQHS